MQWRPKPNSHLAQCRNLRASGAAWNSARGAGRESCDRARARRRARHLRRYASYPAADTVRIREALAEGAAVVVLGFRPQIRRVMAGSWSRAASLSRSARTLTRARPSARSRCATAGSWRSPARPRSRSSSGSANDNRKGEYYLTDAVAIARAMGRRAIVIETEEDDVRGDQHQYPARRDRSRAAGSGCAARRWRPA